jgi:hypothetical protein
MAAFCSKCGAALADGARFCASCGTSRPVSGQGNYLPSAAVALALVGLEVEGERGV